MKIKSDVMNKDVKQSLNWEKGSNHDAMQRTLLLRRPLATPSTTAIRRSVSFYAVPPTSSEKPSAQQSRVYEGSTQAPVTRFKPSESSWYTGSPGFYSVLHRLQNNLHATRTQLHAASILPSYSSSAAGSLAQLGIDSKQDMSAWLTKDRMALHLGTKLSLSEYRLITSTLDSLRALKPHLELADALGLPYSHGGMAQALEEEVLAGFRRTALSSVESKTAKPFKFDQQKGVSYAVGRRKESSAQVWLAQAKDSSVVGETLVNGMPLAEYFASTQTCSDVLRPLALTGHLGKVWVSAKATGGGKSGQAGAVRLALSKALLAFVQDEAVVKAMRKGAFTFSLVFFFFFFGCVGRCLSVCHCGRGLADERPENGRAQEAWSAQGSQEIHLGQAVVSTTQLSIVFQEHPQVVFFCCVSRGGGSRWHGWVGASRRWSIITTTGRHSMPMYSNGSISFICMSYRSHFRSPSWMITVIASVEQLLRRVSLEACLPSRASSPPNSLSPISTPNTRTHAQTFNASCSLHTR